MSEQQSEASEVSEAATSQQPAQSESEQQQQQQSQANDQQQQAASTSDASAASATAEAPAASQAPADGTQSESVPPPKSQNDENASGTTSSAPSSAATQESTATIKSGVSSSTAPKSPASAHTSRTEAGPESATSKVSAKSHRSSPSLKTGEQQQQQQSGSKVEGASSTGKSSTGPASSAGKSSTGKSSMDRQNAGSSTSRPASPKASPQHQQPRRKRMKLGELDLATAKIGFLGAGKMAESTINGLIHYAKVSPSRIHVAAPSSKGLERFKALGCRVTKRNYDIFGRYDCDIIFLCFHGYVIKHCYKLGGARPHPLTTNYIPHQRHPIYILSMVSGVSLSQVKACLLNPESTSNYKLEIHRIMMNTAVGHGLGICAVDCEPDSKRLSGPIRQLLSSIAQLEHVPASQMDAACAVGGSGLAFSYYFINALADGAFRMGLSRQQAIRFASKTAQCAAQTMLESGKHPAELRDNVSSPSGAAIYGIHVLEKNDVASGVTAAVEAAHKRANDLATQDIQ